MIGTRAKRAMFAAAGCLLLASCGPATLAAAPAGTSPAATSVATPAGTATPAATTAAAPAGGSGMTACGLITEQDASTALGKSVGKGTAGGTAALSECVYAYSGGELLVSMKTDSKALYDSSRVAALGKGAPDVPGVGDSAFKSGTPQSCALLFVKGTTLVSILLGGPAAQTAAVAVAKIAAAKL
jgi:hypothetical protein